MSKIEFTIASPRSKPEKKSVYDKEPTQEYDELSVSFDGDSTILSETFKAVEALSKAKNWKLT